MSLTLLSLASDPGVQQAAKVALETATEPVKVFGFIDKTLLLEILSAFAGYVALSIANKLTPHPGTKPGAKRAIARAVSRASFLPSKGVKGVKRPGRAEPEPAPVEKLEAIPSVKP